MEGDCDLRIEEALATLKCAERPHGVPAYTVAIRLIELLPACRRQLHTTAQNLLVGLPGAEPALAVVLEALTGVSDDLAGDLLMSAVGNRSAMRKEDYVSMLDDLDRTMEGERALVAALAAGIDDPSRPDLPATIRALHARRIDRAGPVVVQFLSHPDRTIRCLALAFLYEYDSGALAGPAFAEQLDRETDPVALEILLDGMARWDLPVPAEVLRGVASDPTAPASLRRSADRARPQ